MPELEALNSTVHYEESGSGTPIVFLHGNPSSSHIWREILPRVGPGRLLAPDLIGMGRSGKPDIAYTSTTMPDTWTHGSTGWDWTRVVLAGHDWGGALAFDWAARDPQRVLGLAFLESNRQADGLGRGVTAGAGAGREDPQSPGRGTVSRPGPVRPAGANGPAPSFVAL